MKISVIICAHNPREDYLGKTLAALRKQTLTFESWELMLVDNASDNALEGNWDLSWHPHSRHILEQELGLTPARLRGISEASCELIVFVDDDNVLSADYLEVALSIGEKFPWLGAWGGGCIGEYEMSPPDWLEELSPYIAVRDVKRNSWGNLYEWKYTPLGAGLVVRRRVAIAFNEVVKNDSRRLMLGRKGKALSSGEDIDLAYTAIDLGLGMGRFKELSLLHLIPSSRLEEDYIARLISEAETSSFILSYIRGIDLPRVANINSAKDVLRYFWRLIFWSTRRRKFSKAVVQGRKKGARLLSELGAS